MSSTANSKQARRLLELFLQSNTHRLWNQTRQAKVWRRRSREEGKGVRIYSSLYFTFFATALLTYCTTTLHTVKVPHFTSSHPTFYFTCIITTFTFFANILKAPVLWSQQKKIKKTDNSLDKAPVLWSPNPSSIFKHHDGVRKCHHLSSLFFFKKRLKMYWSCALLRVPNVKKGGFSF